MLGDTWYSDGRACTTEDDIAGLVPDDPSNALELIFVNVDSPTHIIAGVSGSFEGADWGYHGELVIMGYNDGNGPGSDGGRTGRLCSVC